jgi:hypothetical protein
MPLTLLEQINDAALASSYGDILIDPTVQPPALRTDARPFVEALLAKAADTPAPVST